MQILNGVQATEASPAGDGHRPLRSPARAGLVLSADGSRLVTYDATAQQVVALEVRSGAMTARLPTQTGPSAAGDAFYLVSPHGVAKHYVPGLGPAWLQSGARASSVASRPGLAATADGHQAVYLVDDATGSILRRTPVGVTAVEFSPGG